MLHLARRYVRSFRPGNAPSVDLAWARGLLKPEILALFDRLPVFDQRHGVESARAAQQALIELGTEDPGPFIVAALVHDVGKFDAHLGPTRRAFATVVGSIAGRSRTAAWAMRTQGWRARVGRYIEHDVIGAQALAAVGAPSVAVQWAATHHATPATWETLGLPPGVVDALDAADYA
ncbi:MAG: hypothetical protein ACOYN3_04430 [Acidimicrobiia bacterium]